MKKMGYRAIIALGFLGAAVLYLLSVLEGTKESFAWFNLSFAVLIALGVPAVLFLLRGCFEKSGPQFRAFFVIMGMFFSFAAVIALIGALALP
ncbi:MAG: DUF2781 domain-containing protein, partial [Firmicutes bacterium]|nr:DUF2781 domain-containing protein [Bacillota bacterium]